MYYDPARRRPGFGEFSGSGDAENSGVRALKRKMDVGMGDSCGQDSPSAAGDEGAWNARVEVENECSALREALGSHQQTMWELCAELEEERNASASAANEALSMILRLQREKAELQMEVRQYKRFAEEKMAHDQHEIQALEELLYKRDQLIQALNCEIQAYKHRLLSLGGGLEVFEEEMDELEAVEDDGMQHLNSFDYPALKCSMKEAPDSPYAEKCVLEDSPHSWDHLQNLEYRIGQLEKNPDSNFANNRNLLDQSPSRVRHYGQFMQDSPRSFIGMVPTESPRRNWDGFKKRDGNQGEYAEDTNDRVYTIDSIQGVPCNENGLDGYGDGITTAKEPLPREDIGEGEITKLYMRLQALEADRESMRQSLISMRTDKAQLVLLKEIAQHLCKEVMPERRLVVKKPSRTFSLMSILKWILSFVFWRRKAPSSKSMFEPTDNNLGLPLLFDESPRSKLRCLSRSSRM